MATQPSFRAFTVIQRTGQDDLWLNLGLVFPHKDGNGFNLMLQALPLDGKIICREITADEEAEEPAPQRQTANRNGRQSARR